MRISTAQLSRAAVFRWAFSEDWLTWALVCITVLVVVRLVEVAKWVETSSLSLAAILGALLGLVAVRIPGKAWKGHLIALPLGAVAVYLHGLTLIAAEPLLSRAAEFNARWLDWLTALVGNDISLDPLPFAVLLSASAWVMGYLSVWSILRRGNLWLAVIPTSLGLVTNLTYLPERYYVYLFPYLLATMLLMVRLHSLHQASSLARQGIRHPVSLPIIWLVAGGIISSAIVGLAFLIPPTHARHEALKEVWNASRQPVGWFQGEFGRLFASVGGQQAHLSLRFGENLPILPTAPMGQQLIFSGYVSYPVYWKVRAYTTYTAGGWTTENTALETAPSLPLLVDEFLLEEQADITYQVEMTMPTPYLFAPAPAISWVSVPAQVEGDKGAPLFSDMLTLRARRQLRPGDGYTGSFPSAFYTENILRNAGQDFPDWTKGTYLKLPASLPQRVRALALEITRTADHPYDKAKALELYLRQYKYGTPSSTPPGNRDRIDHFLFESKTGHSDHFASAMAVMLRAVGIPARLVSGYGPGLPVKDGGYFQIKAEDQHSWTEVYFPTLGWVEFEPSPIYPPRPRGVSDLLGYTAGLIGPSDGGLPEESGYQDNKSAEEEEDAGGGRLPGGLGFRPFPWVPNVPPWSKGGFLLLGLTLFWVGGLGVVWHRLFMRLPRPELAYQRMSRAAALLTLAPQQGQTPRELGNSLASIIPAARDDIAFICESFCRACYGGATLSIQDGPRLRKAWARVRKEVLHHSFG